LDEVKKLLAKGYSPALPTLSAIGYRECIRVIHGELTEEQARTEIRRATRVFVRRQANWFKETDPEIEWFSMEEGVIDKIEAYIKLAAEDGGWSERSGSETNTNRRLVDF
jgi:tRNA dimethylallyltransferase